MTLNQKVMENAIIRQCAQAIHKAMMKAIGDDAHVAVAKVRTKAGLIEITAWDDERLEVLVAHDNRNETECSNLCKAIENECVFWAIAKDEFYALHSGAFA